MSKNGPDTIGEINLRNWEQTPDRVKRLITNLMEQLGRRVAALEEQCAALKAENQKQEFFKATSSRDCHAYGCAVAQQKLWFSITGGQFFRLNNADSGHFVTLSKLLSIGLSF
jgi:Zn-dependent oligopeptidase